MSLAEIILTIALGVFSAMAVATYMSLLDLTKRYVELVKDHLETRKLLFDLIDALAGKKAA